MQIQQFSLLLGLVAALCGCATPSAEPRYPYAAGKGCLVISMGDARSALRNLLPGSARWSSVQIISTTGQAGIAFTWNPRYMGEHGTPYSSQDNSGVVKVFFVDPGKYKFARFGIYFFNRGPQINTPPGIQFPDFDVESGRCTYAGRLTMLASEHEFAWSNEVTVDMPLIRPHLPPEVLASPHSLAPPVSVPKMVWPQ